MHILLITGLSGSGKTIALNAVEDMGYYCVDNLPPDLLPALVTHLETLEQPYLAVAMDARSSNNNKNQEFNHLPQLIEQLRAKHNVHIIFLNAQDDVLVRRFSETRRPHPLSMHINQKNYATLEQVIHDERSFLSEMCDKSYTIDTSMLQTNRLRQILQEVVQKMHTKPIISEVLLSIQSFGFKYGIPNDADFTFDVRHLPNPYYDEKIRHYSGLDQPIQDFFEQDEAIHEIVKLQIKSIVDYLHTWLPHFNNQRAYISVAIGCTGGQHRSVYIAEKIHQQLQHNYMLIRHKNIIKN
jgi:RNase adapter protein RapZ